MLTTSVSCHKQFDLVWMTSWPFLYLFRLLGWKINCDLSSLIARWLYWQMGPDFSFVTVEFLPPPPPQKNQSEMSKPRWRYELISGLIRPIVPVQPFCHITTNCQHFKPQEYGQSYSGVRLTCNVNFTRGALSRMFLSRGLYASGVLCSKHQFSITLSA